MYSKGIKGARTKKNLFLHDLMEVGIEAKRPLLGLAAQVNDPEFVFAA